MVGSFTQGDVLDKWHRGLIDQHICTHTHTHTPHTHTHTYRPIQMWIYKVNISSNQQLTRSLSQIFSHMCYQYSSLTLTKIVYRWSQLTLHTTSVIPKLELYHQMLFYVIFWAALFCGSYPSTGDSQHILNPTDSQHILSPINSHHILSPTNSRNILSPTNSQHYLSPTNSQHILSPINNQNILSPINRKHFKPY